MLGEAQTEIPRGNPMRDAWEAWKQTEDYRNALHWAVSAPGEHAVGSLWAAFVKGWQARDSIRSTPSTAAFSSALTGEGDANGR